jgi:hypothetical protein
MAKDIRVEFYMDAAMWLGLRYRAEKADRSVSQHLRNLVRADLEEASAELASAARGERGVTEGEAA